MSDPATGVARTPLRIESILMKSVENHDLQEPEQSVGKTIKRAIRRPRKVAPKPEVLREWARSSVKSRNKS